MQRRGEAAARPPRTRYLMHIRSFWITNYPYLVAKLLKIFSSSWRIALQGVTRRMATLVRPDLTI